MVGRFLLFGRIELLNDQYREWVLTKYLKISGLPSSSPYGCWLRKMPSRVGLGIFITTTREGSRGGNRGGSSTIAAAMRSSIDNDDRSGRDMLDAPARIVRQMRLS